MNKLMCIVVTVFTHHVVKLFQLLNPLTLLTLMCRRVTCRQSQITDSAEYVHISAPIFMEQLNLSEQNLVLCLLCYSAEVRQLNNFSPKAPSQ